MADRLPKTTPFAHTRYNADIVILGETVWALVGWYKKWGASGLSL